MKPMLQTLMVLALAFNFNACSTSKTVDTGRQANEGPSAEMNGTPAASSAVAADAEGVARGEGRPYRGQIGERQIVMRLQRAGENLSGTYAYEGIGQNLTLKGRVDARGKVSLQEFDASGKQTGAFAGQWTEPSDQESATTIEGQWSRPDGSHGVHFEVTEQPIEFTGNLNIVTKTIKESRFSIDASYPQITGSNEPAIASFNQKAQALVSQAVKEFKDGEPVPDRSSYSTSYNILLATDDLISVEIVEDSYAGGAHPNINYYTLNYDLRTGREIQLKDLFKPNADYKKAIQQYALKDLNARAREDAKKENLPPDQQTEELFSQDQLSEWSGWTMTRKGLYVYFDVPHVIAVYSREFIPARVIKDQLNPQRAIMK